MHVVTVLRPLPNRMRNVKEDGSIAPPTHSCARVTASEGIFIGQEKFYNPWPDRNKGGKKVAN